MWNHKKSGLEIKAWSHIPTVKANVMPKLRVLKE